VHSQVHTTPQEGLVLGLRVRSFNFSSSTRIERRRRSTRASLWGDALSCTRRLLPPTAQAERRTRASALHACVPFRLCRGNSMWPDSTPSLRSSWSEASRVPRAAAPVVARARRRSASGQARRRAPCGARWPGGPASDFAAAPAQAARRAGGRPTAPASAPRASQRASRPSGGAPCVARSAAREARA